MDTPTTSTPLRVVVDRSKWRRGAMPSFLLDRESEQMCCLGFLAIACGYTPDQIRGVTSPARLATRGPILGSIKDLITSNVVMTKEDNSICYQMMEVNDQAKVYTGAPPSSYRTFYDDERESHLIILGREVGIAFEFVDHEEAEEGEQEPS